MNAMNDPGRPTVLTFLLVRDYFGYAKLYIIVEVRNKHYVYDQYRIYLGLVKI